MDFTKDEHICRPQNLFQVYFYISFERNFIFKFKSWLYLNFLAYSHHLIFLVFIILFYFCFVYIYIYIYIFSFLFSFSSLFSPPNYPTYLFFFSHFLSCHFFSHSPTWPFPLSIFPFLFFSLFFPLVSIYSLAQRNRPSCSLLVAPSTSWRRHYLLATPLSTHLTSFIFL